MGKSVEIVKVRDKHIEVMEEVYYHGRTGGYQRNEIVIVRILDKNNQEVKALWEKDWREIAPGIETREWHEGTTLEIGSRRQEAHYTKRVRIHRKACPVRIRFLSTDEYNDYDYSEFSSSHSRAYWVQYEV